MDSLDRATLGVWLGCEFWMCQISRPAAFDPTSASLQESPCPNHPCYRCGAVTQLDIQQGATCTRILSLLGPFSRSERWNQFCIKNFTNSTANLRAVFASSRTKAVTSVNIKGIFYNIWNRSMQCIGAMHLHCCSLRGHLWDCIERSNAVA